MRERDRRSRRAQRQVRGLPGPPSPPRLCLLPLTRDSEAARENASLQQWLRGAECAEWAPLPENAHWQSERIVERDVTAQKRQPLLADAVCSEQAGQRGCYLRNPPPLPQTLSNNGTDKKDGGDWG